MKRFWITYSVATVALLPISSLFFVGLPLGILWAIASGLSTLWLFRRRTALSQQKHLVLLALLASIIASFLTGFILLFTLCAAGAIWDNL